MPARAVIPAGLSALDYTIGLNLPATS